MQVVPTQKMMRSSTRRQLCAFFECLWQKQERAMCRSHVQFGSLYRYDSYSTHPYASGVEDLKNLFRESAAKRNRTKKCLLNPFGSIHYSLCHPFGCGVAPFIALTTQYLSRKLASKLTVIQSTIRCLICPHQKCPIAYQLQLHASLMKILQLPGFHIQFSLAVEEIYNTWLLNGSFPLIMW